MEKLSVHFCSHHPFLLNINGAFFGQLENQTDDLLLEIQNEKSFLLEAKPISNENFLPSAPFCVDIKIKNNKLFSLSPQIEITKFDKNIFEIFVKPLLLLQNSPKKVLETVSVNKNVEVIFCDCGFFVFEVFAFSQIFCYKVFEKLENIKCEFFEQENVKFLLISGKTQKNRDFLMILENFFCKWQIEADLIEQNKNEILALDYAHDIAQHGIVKKFELNNTRYVLKEEYVVFCEKEPQEPTSSSLVPLAFVEAVNLEDFKLARTFLNSELNSVLSDDHLKNFFGNFEEFGWNKHKNKENCICFVFSGNPKTVKNFEFVLENGKIANILELSKS